MKPKPEVSSLLFGKYFTDHMLEVNWDSDKGWSTPLISPLHYLQLHPAAKVLHYAIEVCTSDLFISPCAILRIFDCFSSSKA